MLQEQAMLVSLNISQWTARKYDKKASKEVEDHHAATSAGRFNKVLIERKHLKDIDASVAAVRDFHYTRTLPWGDNGDRLLPSKLFMNYRNSINKLIDQFRVDADRFTDRYPIYVADARKNLSTLYEPTDYPPVSDIRRRFSMSIAITPVPSAADFRVDVGAEDARRIRTEITETIETRQKAAVQDCFARAKEVVLKMRERLGDTNAVFRDSLVGNVRDLVDILPAMNITNDPELTELCAAMQTELLVPPSRLRDDEHLRSATSLAADAILAKFKLI